MSYGSRDNRRRQWDRDLQIEHLAAPFLDVHFYDAVFAGRYLRATDLNEQYVGIDVKLYGKDDAEKLKPVFIDEKYKVYGCLNRVYPAPGFELSLLNKAGRVQDGWLANERNKTQIYATVGLSATVDDVKALVSVDQITGADILLNTKKSIIDYIQRYTSFDQLKQDAAALRDSYENSLGGKHRLQYKHGKFWLTYSAGKDEKPVNVVIPRITLESLENSVHYVCMRNRKPERIQSTSLEVK